MKLENKSVTQLKTQAWKLCSEYVRKRDADWRGNVTCITCMYKSHWKDMDAGHFIPSRVNGILFDTRGIYAQCKQCNMNGGNPVPYYKIMLRLHGQDVIDELQKQKDTPKRFTKEELIEIIEDFKEKLCGQSQ